MHSRTGANSNVSVSIKLNTRSLALNAARAPQIILRRMGAKRTGRTCVCGPCSCFGSIDVNLAKLLAMSISDLSRQSKHLGVMIVGSEMDLASKPDMLTSDSWNNGLMFRQRGSFLLPQIMADGLLKWWYLPTCYLGERNSPSADVQKCQI
ncbi:MAG: hypothetical protein ACKER6_00950 [Candidatus Hodgkinia cicadicola]